MVPHRLMPATTRVLCFLRGTSADGFGGLQWSQRIPVWLDKVCIDQEHISDGLRVLPVNAMACGCFVADHTRLVCIWELFAAMALVIHDFCLEADFI